MKLKRLSILFTLMLAISTFFSSFAFAENLDKPSLVALGDSITYGWNLDDTNGNTQPSLKAFPNLIIENGFFNVTNISGGGWTSGNILTQVQDPANDEAIQNADVFTLDIGSNDLMQAIGLSEIIKNGTPINTAELLPKVAAASEQLGMNLQVIFGKVRELNQDAPIILYNIYNPFGASEDPFKGFLHNVGEQIVTNVNTSVISRFAVVPGTYIADAKTAVNGKQSEYIIPGDIHPNETGQAVLAGLGTEILLSLLPQEPTLVLTADPAGETTGPVTIQVTTDAEEVLFMMWLKGEKTVDDFYDEEDMPVGTEITDNKFEVTENGTYTVYLLDGNGMEAVKSITIETIKTEAPPVNPTPVDNNPAPASTKPAAPATGHPLPNTASPAYNYVAMGAAVLLAGLIAMKVQNRRRKEV